MAETYMGEVRNGVVVFEDPEHPLPEGTRVTIEPICKPTRTLADRLRRVIGKTEGLPVDMADQHDHYLHGQPKR